MQLNLIITVETEDDETFQQTIARAVYNLDNTDGITAMSYRFERVDAKSRFG